MCLPSYAQSAQRLCSGIQAVFWRYAQTQRRALKRSTVKNVQVKILDKCPNKAVTVSWRLPSLSAEGLQSMSFDNRVKTESTNSDQNKWKDKGSFEATFSLNLN